MLESKQRTNAWQINSESTAKSLKTRSFCSQVNSRQPSLVPIWSRRRRSGCALGARFLAHRKRGLVFV